MSDFSTEVYCGVQYLKDYFQSLPNIADNPIGVYNRKCVLNRLKVAVPGKAVIMICFIKIPSPCPTRVS